MDTETDAFIGGIQERLIHELQHWRLVVEQKLLQLEDLPEELPENPRDIEDWSLAGVIYLWCWLEYAQCDVEAGRLSEYLGTYERFCADTYPDILLDRQRLALTKQLQLELGQ